ncbi:hypothetical protein OG601_00215 [Streptomyces sp. NBC_01239]|uniref:hypothetical protein n=1 Tax=Streptomyces sp. NBC_01239 TaxID=2903792 RepID=UPI002257A7B9|nr:hypothetical protein [Streptomyces sp. NBC_01239]MCX4809046.1 hypothetical protein [Streptomyces sp. NBC_01239]
MSDGDADLKAALREPLESGLEAARSGEAGALGKDGRIEVGPRLPRGVVVADVLADGDEHHALGRREVRGGKFEYLDNTLDPHYCTAVRRTATARATTRAVCIRLGITRFLLSGVRAGP